MRSEATASGTCANTVPRAYHSKPVPQRDKSERSHVDTFPSPDESISACVPSAALRVFDSISIQDYDTPHERCGWALRWLESAGLVVRCEGGRHGAQHSAHPVLVTEAGRELSRERSQMLGRGGVELW